MKNHSLQHRLWFHNWVGWLQSLRWILKKYKRCKKFIKSLHKIRKVLSTAVRKLDDWYKIVSSKCTSLSPIMLQLLMQISSNGPDSTKPLPNTVLLNYHLWGPLLVIMNLKVIVTENVFENCKSQQKLPALVNQSIYKRRPVPVRFNLVMQYHLLVLNQRSERRYQTDSTSNQYQFRDSSVMQYNIYVPCL